MKTLLSNIWSAVSCRKAWCICVRLSILYIAFALCGERIETYITFPAAGYDSWSSTFSDTRHFFLTDPDGYRVSVAYIDHGSLDTMIYFCGNGGGVNKFVYDMHTVASYGYNVIAYDYPGYGESDGRASEDRVRAFSEVVYQYLTTDRRVPPERIGVWGYSIGAAIAVDLASRHPMERVVLMAPFTSRYDMSRQIFGFALQPWLLRGDSLVSIDRVRSITAPTLIIHGDADRTIGYSMGRRVYESSASHDKRFITLKNGDHNGILDYYGDGLRAPIEAFLAGKTYDREITIDRDGLKKVSR